MLIQPMINLREILEIKPQYYNKEGIHLQRFELDKFSYYIEIDSNGISFNCKYGIGNNIRNTMWVDENNIFLSQYRDYKNDIQRINDFINKNNMGIGQNVKFSHQDFIELNKDDFQDIGKLKNKIKENENIIQYKNTIDGIKIIGTYERNFHPITNKEEIESCYETLEFLINGNWYSKSDFFIIN